MNVYETKTMAERLNGNTYPGRGIVLGVTADGPRAVAAYFIMGRSVNSRNRVFCLEPDGIRTEAHDPALMKDPHLIIYHPVRELGKGLIVTNGDQTDTIWEFAARGESWEAALQAASLNVVINTKTLRNRAVAEEMNAKALGMMAEYGAIADEIFNTVKAGFGV